MVLPLHWPSGLTGSHNLFLVFVKSVSTICGQETQWPVIPSCWSRHVLPCYVSSQQLLGHRGGCREGQTPGQELLCCHPHGVGLLWCSCLWVTCASIGSPPPIFLKVTTGDSSSSLRFKKKKKEVGKLWTLVMSPASEQCKACCKEGPCVGVQRPCFDTKAWSYKFMKGSP